jgi:hypothetical protein
VQGIPDPLKDAFDHGLAIVVGVTLPMFTAAKSAIAMTPIANPAN